jgi:hypothetical protein
MTLPGMPPRYGDPGVFVCGPEDIAPWEAPRKLRAAPPPPPAGGVPRGVWLVMHLCGACARRRSYCRDHRLDWLFKHLIE